MQCVVWFKKQDRHMTTVFHVECSYTKNLYTNWPPRLSLNDSFIEKSKWVETDLSLHSVLRPIQSSVHDSNQFRDPEFRDF